MSQKHLFKFQQENDYKTAKRNHLIIPNVSTVVESGNTYVNSNFVSKENAEAGDIIVFHEEEDGTKAVRYMKPEAFDKNNGYWTADAIVVVPFSHTGDGTVRAVGVNFASCDTPSEGGSGEAIVWGEILYTDEVNLENIESYKVFSTIQDQTEESTYGVSEEGYCPSDTFTNTLNPFDTDTYYDANNEIIPSPYKNDGSLNALYDLSTTYKDGRYNTEQIIKSIESEYVADMVYGDTIDNSTYTDAPNYPSTIACLRYSSVLKPCVFDETKTLEENLETMPWYQPSIGEVGYYISRLGRINYAKSRILSETYDDEYVVSSSTVGPIVDTTTPNIAIANVNGEFGFFELDSDNPEMLAVPFCKF